MVELEKRQAEFAKQGIGVAAITYDKREALAHFAARKGLTYPLLSDPDFKIIRAFGILNLTIPKDSPAFGIPHPGTFLVDERGFVRAKYFEADYRDRFTAANILLREFGAATTEAAGEGETRHLKLRYWASDAAVRTGSRLTLTVDVELKPGMHVYAPGVKGYIPLQWDLAESPAWRAEEPKYPASRMMNLPVIRETVPVFEGHFRIVRDLTITEREAAIGPLLDRRREFEVESTFRYQACDDKVCYPSQTIPLRWRLRLEVLDRERVPDPLRR